MCIPAHALCFYFCRYSPVCGKDFVVHGVVFAVGTVIVMGTGTWSSLTFLYNDTDNGEPNLLQWCLQMHDADDLSGMTQRDHVRYITRSLLSIIGQVRGVC
jgi:hypothetical protein